MQVPESKGLGHMAAHPSAASACSPPLRRAMVAAKESRPSGLRAPGSGLREHGTEGHAWASEASTCSSSVRAMVAATKSDRQVLGFRSQRAWHVGAHLGVGGLRTLLLSARNGGSHEVQAVGEGRQLDQAMAVTWKIIGFRVPLGCNMRAQDWAAMDQAASVSRLRHQALVIACKGMRGLGHFWGSFEGTGLGCQGLG